MKIRIGIVFGGTSREREVSFAGGRTVYDNLNKSVFEPVPLFIDSFGNIIQLDWQFIYKGSIRDFYPPVEFIPRSPGGFQIYAESLSLAKTEEQLKLIRSIGKKIGPEELRHLVDFVFLCLHGPMGEDGRIQGLLEYYGIPYSGSGILSSSIGINKAVQKEFMKAAGFPSPAFYTIRKDEWLRDKERVITRLRSSFASKAVVKPANQGSSIGVSILKAGASDHDWEKAIDLALFRVKITAEIWKNAGHETKLRIIRQLADIREGIGMPVWWNGTEIVRHPDLLFKKIEKHFGKNREPVILEAVDGENEVLAEAFIEGREFSCIVIRNEDGKPAALPPTEIRKSNTFFDYRSKYLPGLSRKVTPIDLPDNRIMEIRNACERLFNALHFNVYARIDGFIARDGTIYLNDPNTTSGMMPSSFFFHQAAEIGLNPSQFLTYIIRTSLKERADQLFNPAINHLLVRLDQALYRLKTESRKKIKVAVILGGYSSERHISVESGRNIYEKLSSSEKYEPIPLFLTGNDQEHTLYRIPINILLKDNADDIREKIFNYQVHPVLKEIVKSCGEVTTKYADSKNLQPPQKIAYPELAGMADAVFIALHGRPGEDGNVQAELEKAGLPYNGSGIASSRITINKYETNEKLKQHGFLVANHFIAGKEEWKKNPAGFSQRILSQFSFPFIVKPVDDGCSSAVKKIRNRADLDAYASAIFRNEEKLPDLLAEKLQIKPEEEFPRKEVFLVEELIDRGRAKHFLEITGGMVTHYRNGKTEFELFEPSEALSGGDVLSLEEKFLAGEGQNITPARYSPDRRTNALIGKKVKTELGRAAKLLDIEGYARIDAFVRIFDKNRVEVIFIEVNSLPGMTPATCIFHQCALSGYKPLEFINQILEYGIKKRGRRKKNG